MSGARLSLLLLLRAVSVASSFDISTGSSDGLLPPRSPVSLDSHHVARYGSEKEKKLYVLWANKRDYESSVPRASNEYTYDIIRKRIVIAFTRRIRDAKIDTPIFACYWPYELCIKTRCLIYARLACATANVNVDVVWRRRRVPASNIGNKQQRNGWSRVNDKIVCETRWWSKK